jgi:putative FmdB family regulatory protein
MRYDFKCEEHGTFEAKQSLADHTGTYECPTCGKQSKQVILSAPRPNIEAMADAGCPGAFMTSGDRMEQRHKEAGQDHHYWRDDV